MPLDAMPSLPPPSVPPVTPGGEHEAEQRKRFHARTQEIFLESMGTAARWRMALFVPFYTLVVAVLCWRGESPGHCIVQFTIVVVSIGLLFFKNLERPLLSFAVSMVLFAATLANTGGLASPFLVLGVPMLIGVALKPDLEGRRGKLVFMFLTLMALLGAFSFTKAGHLSGPLADRGDSPSVVYILFTFSAVSLAAFVIHTTGRRVAAVYEQVAVELATRREELFYESEDRTRALEGIAARMAHEVKNPLAAIRGLSAHVAKNSDDPKVRERLELVCSEAARLQEIVDGFLSFSRGLEDLKVGPVSPFEIARELSLLLETRTRDAGVTLVVQGSPEVVLNADERKLRQALLNLMLNAIQASKEGGKITVEIARTAAGAATIRVIDRGHGMSADVLERIKRPYFTTKENGSGLGIAVARALVEQHGGSLRFESAAARGTTATLELPACAAKAASKGGRFALPPCKAHAPSAPAEPARESGERGPAVPLVLGEPHAARAGDR